MIQPTAEIVHGQTRCETHECRSFLYIVSLWFSPGTARAVDQRRSVADHIPMSPCQGGHVFSRRPNQTTHVPAERLDPDVEDGGGGKAPRGGGEGYVGLCDNGI
jgi:hypothetical protein